MNVAVENVRSNLFDFHLVMLLSAVSHDVLCTSVNTTNVDHVVRFSLCFVFFH